METKVNNNHEMQVVQNEHMQMMPMQQMQSWYNDFVTFSKSILKSNLDYGIIPGTPKPSLYKPGAEKLRFVYGLGIEFECIDKIVDLDRPFVDYSYRCTVRSKQGQVLSQCEGNCNSLEAKFGYLWKTINELPEGADISNLPTKTTGKKLFEFYFAIEKKETTGQYGKPAEYWQMWENAIMNNRARKVSKKSKAGKDLDGWELDETVTVYRILNPDVVGVKNTIMKMAQKRAFVGAILLATGASEFFTQDIEDMEINGAIYSDNHAVEDIQAEFIRPYVKSDIEGANPGSQISTPDHVPAQIAGSWYAKLERCKTPEDVDALAVANKITIEANPELKNLFGRTKKQLREKAEKEAAHV